MLDSNSGISQLALGQLITSYPFITPYTFYLELCDAGLFMPSDTRYVHMHANHSIFDVKEGAFVYCVTDRAPELYNNLPRFQNRISIVFGRSTLPVSDVYIPFVESDRVISVAAQNCTSLDGRFIGIPLGIENRNWRSDGFPSNDISLLLSYISKSFHSIRKYKYLAAFSLHTAPTERSECLRALLNREGLYIPRLNTKTRTREVITSYYHELISSQYVICPPGAGLDTHRFWQALYLGCKPILLNSDILPYVRSSFATDDYVALESWNEIDDVTQSLCSSKPINFMDPNSPLSFEYWRRAIFDHQSRFA